MRLNETIASAARIPILMTSTSTGALTASLTFSGSEVQVSKNGSAWTNAAGTVSEVGGAGNGAGAYYYETTTSERDTRGYLVLKINKSGYEPWIFEVPIEPFHFVAEGTVASATAGTLVLDGAGSTVNDFYNGGIVSIVAGLGVGQFRTIADYVGGTKTITLDANWTTTPDATSKWQISPAGAAPTTSGVAAAVWAYVLEGAHTAGDLVRGAIGVLAGPSTGYASGTIVAKSLSGAKTRWTWTTDETGRLTVTPGDLT